MTESQKKAARRRYQGEREAMCPHCDGRGRILSPGVQDRARKGGNASYLKSLEQGQLTMSARGARGGRPNEPTLERLSDMS